MPSARSFAVSNTLGTRQTSCLPSVTEKITTNLEHSANKCFAECCNRGTSANIFFAKCLLKDTRQRAARARHVQLAVEPNVGKAPVPVVHLAFNTI